MEPSATDLLLRLNSPDTEIAIEAARELRMRNPRQVARLVLEAAELQAAPVQRAIGFVVFPLVFAVWALIIAHSLFIAIAVLVLLAVAAGAGAIRGGKQHGFLRTPTMTVCYNALAIHIESNFNAESLPALVTLLHHDLHLPVRVRRSIQAALLRALPAIAYPHWQALDASERKWFTEIVTTPHADIGLRVGVTEAISRIVDPNDNEIRLLLNSYKHGSPITANMDKMRSAAAAALNRLNERAAKLNSSQTLLRASDAPSTLPTELLRPAAASGSPPEQLVRAAGSQEDHYNPLAPNSR